MAQMGKKYVESIKVVDRQKAYGPREALELVKEAAYAKFDETVELHLRLGVDPRHADQQVRGVVLLPHGLGKKVRVMVFTQGEGVKIAEEAGADYAGADDFIKRVEEGWLDFDVALATPDIMGKVGKLGKILGRRGLMPNPKSGTIAPAPDLPRLIQDARKGRVEFKLERTGLIHVPIGKLSFGTDKLLENLTSLVDAIVRAKPTGAKGQFVHSISVASSMGPGVKLDLPATLSLSAAA